MISRKKTPPPALTSPDERYQSGVVLHLWKPIVEGLDADSGWAFMRKHEEHLRVAFQKAVATVIQYIQQMRASGRIVTPSNKLLVDHVVSIGWSKKLERLGTGKLIVSKDLRAAAEKDARWPKQWWTRDDENKVSRIFYQAAAHDVYVGDQIEPSLVSQVLQASYKPHFSGTRLRDLVEGRRAYPDVKRVTTWIHNTHWSLTIEKVERPDKKRPGKTITSYCPIIEIDRLTKQGPKVKLVCKYLSGSKAVTRLAKLEIIAAFGRETKKGDLGRSALQISLHKDLATRRTVWKILPSYSSPPASLDSLDKYMIIRRGITNMLTMGVLAADGSIHYKQISGADLVHKKGQFMRRRSKINKGTSEIVGRRWRRRRYVAMRKVSDIEARHVRAYISNCTKTVIRFIDEQRPKFLSIAKLSERFKSDDNLPPYIRNFPLFALKETIASRSQRDTGISIVEETDLHEMKKCPACGHSSSDNLLRHPSLKGGEVLEHGIFKCQLEDCGYVNQPDAVAILNAFASHDLIPAVAKEAMRATLLKERRYMKAFKEAQKNGS